MGLKAEQIKRIAGVLSVAGRREATRDNGAWDKLENLKEALGADQLLEEILASMSTEEAHETFDFIGRNYDISFGQEDFEMEARRSSKRKQADEARAEYYQTLRRWAKELIVEAQEQADEEGVDIDEVLYDKLYELAGDNEWVIYTGKALSVLNNSDNWLAAC